MPGFAELRGRLAALEGAGYKAYRTIEGRYEADGWSLTLQRAQGDPFATPSRLRAHVSAGFARLPTWAFPSPDRRRAAADFLNRALARALAERAGRMGSGRSGELGMLEPGQQVLERTSSLLGPDGAVEFRFRAGLPARGRRVLGTRAAELLCDRVPAALRSVLPLEPAAVAALRTHVETVEDSVALRAALPERGLVAFVADGALLPRRSGVDDRPLERSWVRPFVAPAGLRVELRAPNAGVVHGLGVPAGVTVIVGGGYHGKSTLLSALERGVYDHVPADGRQQVVTCDDAVKVRAEDGRAIAGTDISAFIGRLPDGSDTSALVTANASGSTSQAAAIAEALEVGARLLLVDEDTCATNFMIRDARMQALVPEAKEPITPFIDRVRTLYEIAGVSTVLVAGGSGDYFDVADTVIAMEEYLPRECTDAAKSVAAAMPSGRRSAARAWTPPRARVPMSASFDHSGDRGRTPIRVHETGRLVFGGSVVVLDAVEQLVERAQTAAIAQVLAGPANPFDGRETIAAGARAVLGRIGREGLDVIDEEPMDGYASFRVFELAAFLNRLRSLDTVPAGEDAAEAAAAGADAAATGAASDGE